METGKPSRIAHIVPSFPPRDKRESAGGFPRSLAAPQRRRRPPVSGAPIQDAGLRPDFMLYKPGVK